MVDWEPEFKIIALLKHELIQAMDVTITINTPVLTGGKTFKVRYRQLPAGTWSGYSTRTYAPFTLTGLAAGEYELEVILVNADSSECPPTYRKFSVVTPFECTTFTAAIVQNGSLYNLEINYTTPATSPACGWTIVYDGNVVNYPMLPAPPLKIPVANKPVHLQVIANNCKGNQRACFSGDIPAIPDPPCTPLVLNTGAGTITYLSTLSSGLYKFRIGLVFTQSSPCSTAFSLFCNQLNVLAGLPGQVSYPAYSFGPVLCTATGLSFEILANPNVQFLATTPGVEERKFDFVGTLIDKCGKVHGFGFTVNHV